VQEDELRLQVERYRRDVRAEADRGKSTMERMEEFEASLEKSQVRCLVSGRPIEGLARLSNSKGMRVSPDLGLWVHVPGFGP
jgi:hypothetical protein